MGSALSSRLGRLVYAVVLAGVAVPTTALAQQQGREQSKCITALNKAASKVAAAQAKQSASCLKAAARGRESDPAYQYQAFDFTNPADSRLEFRVYRHDRSYLNIDKVVASVQTGSK